MKPAMKRTTRFGMLLLVTLPAFVQAGQPMTEGNVRRYVEAILHHRVDRLQPSVKSEIVGRWFLSPRDSTDSIKRYLDDEFCEFRADGTAYTRPELGRYEVRKDRIVVVLNGEPTLTIFRVKGRFYTPSHEDGAILLVRCDKPADHPPVPLATTSRPRTLPTP